MMTPERFVIVCIEIIFVFSLLSQLSRSSESEEPGIINTKMRSDSVANNISMKSFSLNYQNNRRNIFWPYDYSRPAAFDFGLNILQNEGNTSQYTFEGNHIAGILGRMFSPDHYLNIFVGTHVLQNTTQDKIVTDHHLLTQGLGYAYKHDNFQLSFDYKKDFMYTNLFLPAGVEHTLVENKFEIVTKIKLAKALESSISLKHSLVNDKNQLTSFGAELNGGYEVHPFSIFGGMSTSYGQSKFITSRYPSPWYVLGAGPNLGANYSFRDTLIVSSGMAYTRFIDHLKIEGSEINKFFQLEFGNRNSL
ncbi:MAG: hypothetical protein AABY86_11830 [Bdellovibrionota bacterium]